PWLRLGPVPILLPSSGLPLKPLALSLVGYMPPACSLLAWRLWFQLLRHTRSAIWGQALTRRRRSSALEPVTPQEAVEVDAVHVGCRSRLRNLPLVLGKELLEVAPLESLDDAPAGLRVGKV